MKHSAKAFAPGNISCIFQIHEDVDPAKMGSMGLGFTINKGVTVTVETQHLASVQLQKTEIFFNGEKIEFSTVEDVVKKVTKPIPSGGWDKGLGSHNVKVSLSSPLPLGGGFGLSGASALATAYAINDLFALKKTKLDLAKIAHIAEVENKTGLGDVTNQYFGGCLVKTVPSSEFKVQRIPLENTPVYCKFFSKLSTKSVLSDKESKEKINRAATEALEKVQSLLQEKKKIAFSDIISLSKEFAENSGLLTDQQVTQTIQEIESRSGHASMIMLGNGVFSDIPFDGADEFFITS